MEGMYTYKQTVGHNVFLKNNRQRSEYIYIYIQRERERERERDTHTQLLVQRIWSKNRKKTQVQLVIKSKPKSKMMKRAVHEGRELYNLAWLVGQCSEEKKEENPCMYICVNVCVCCDYMTNIIMFDDGGCCNPKSMCCYTLPSSPSPRQLHKAPCIYNLLRPFFLFEKVQKRKRL